MTDQTTHYATLIRLQVAMSALQDLVCEANKVAADAEGLDDEQIEAFRVARQMASQAIQIALGGQNEVPERLTRNWASETMARDASRVLAASNGR